MPCSHVQVEDLLPHRHPFLFVDRVISLVPGTKIEGIFHIESDHPFVNRTGVVPVFPTTMVVEALGQTAAICVRHREKISSPPGQRQGFLVRVDHCSFEHPSSVGEDLLLQANLIKHFATLYKFDAIARVGDKTVVRALLTLYLES